MQRGPHTVTTTDIKTVMRHIHTSIVSRHLATRGNNKIMRTPPPHISSSEERLPSLTCRTLVQLGNTNLPFLKHTYTKSTPNHTHHQHAPSATPTHTITSTLHICTTLSPLDLWTDPSGVMEMLARWRDMMDQKRDDRTSVHHPHPHPPPPPAHTQGSRVGRHNTTITIVVYHHMGVDVTPQ